MRHYDWTTALGDNESPAEREERDATVAGMWEADPTPYTESDYADDMREAWLAAYVPTRDQIGY